MATSRRTHPLRRLAGKKVVFHGKFDFGRREHLASRAEAQQAQVVDDLDASVDYLVVPDLTGGKTVQKKAASLNASGASIEVLDPTSFEPLVAPTAADVIALLRMGKAGGELLTKALGIDPSHHFAGMVQWQPAFTFADEDFSGLNLTRFDFGRLRFERCRFIRAKLADAQFAVADRCDFSHADAAGARFSEAPACRFANADLQGARFEGSIDGSDFAGAKLGKARFADLNWGYMSKPGPVSGGVSFTKADLRGAAFTMTLKAPDFTSADLRGTVFNSGVMKGAIFRGAKLDDAAIVGCNLTGADFTNASLVRANLSGSDLTGASLDGADLTQCNLRGAKLEGVDLATARHYDPAALPAGSVGPALTELDALARQARRIVVKFHVSDPAKKDEDAEVGLDTAGLRNGWGLRVPYDLHARLLPAAVNRQNQAFSDAMLELANLLPNRRVRYETLELESTRSPTSGKELRELVIAGIAEAFAQPAPPAEELAEATRAWRGQIRRQTAAQRAKREKVRAAQEKKKEAAKQEALAKIDKEVGPVTDVAGFLKALELRIDKPKISKATSMLKAAGFQLYSDITDEHLAGVVKSQTDPDLVYACRLEHDGHYACCTQNLNVCGGLRGSPCKHLLVLIIGLVQAGELDPATMDLWVAQTHGTKPELDKEKMSEVFIRYKGAEAGEVDWRPTETVPEDYYAL